MVCCWPHTEVWWSETHCVGCKDSGLDLSGNDLAITLRNSSLRHFSSFSSLCRYSQLSTTVAVCWWHWSPALLVWTNFLLLRSLISLTRVLDHRLSAPVTNCCPSVLDIVGWVIWWDVKPYSTLLLCTSVLELHAGICDSSLTVSSRWTCLDLCR